MDGRFEIINWTHVTPREDSQSETMPERETETVRAA
jgi:hypothetical protein